LRTPSRRMRSRRAEEVRAASDKKAEGKSGELSVERREEGVRMGREFADYVAVEAMWRSPGWT
jgi:hypothetical protein